jgi:hypothetical protein
MVDKFVAANLYGASGKTYRKDMNEDDLSTLEESLLNLSTSFARNTKRVQKIQLNSRKLSVFETYIALIKGYCAIVILTLPKAFENGGYLMSPFLMLGAALLTTLCVRKLIETGLKYEIYCYSMIV